MKNRALTYTIGFAIIGVIIICLVAYVQHSIFNTHERNRPYQALVDNLRHKATLGHLRFEELLTGDTTVSFERDVLKEFVSCSSILQSAYDGKTSEAGSFYKSSNEDTRAFLKEAIIDADQLIEIGKQFYSAHQTGTSSNTKLEVAATETITIDSISNDSLAIASTEVPTETEPTFFTEAGERQRLNLAFDKAFDEFQVSLNNLSGHIRKVVKTDADFLNTLSWLSIGVVIFVFIILGILLYRDLHNIDVLSTEAQTRLDNQAGITNQLSDFVDAVSSGNFDVKLDLSGEAGGLTDKLVNMRNTLKENAENERKRGWSTMGLAQVGEILRSTTTSSTELYDSVIRFLVKYTKSNQGGLFVISEEAESENLLELVACYAFERKKFLSKTLQPGEGLVGQCFLEGETIILNEVPEEYVSISSGLGGSKPKSIILVPMKLNEQIYGVIELATFTHYEDYQVELVEKLAENIASAISTVRTNESTRILLEKTQQQTEEMKAQEEEIRQNMEELEATQEEMQRKHKVMEEELQEFQAQAETLRIKEKSLVNTQQMLQTIIDNIPKAVFWKDMDLNFKGGNKLFVKIAGVSSIQDIIGKTDFDMAWQARATAYRADDLEVIKSKKAKLNVEERNVKSDGTESWILTSKVPINNDKGEVVAILGMFEDITDRKRTESDIAQKLQEREKALKEISDLKRLLEAKG